MTLTMFALFSNYMSLTGYWVTFNGSSSLSIPFVFYFSLFIALSSPLV